MPAVSSRVLARALRNRPKLSILLATAASASCLVGGCSSLPNGHSQSGGQLRSQAVSLEARHQGKTVNDAKCELKNDKGTWYLSTPGTVTLQRSVQDLLVKCERDNQLPGALVVRSRPDAANGDATAASSGDYPALIVIEMGKSATYTDKVPRKQATK